MAYILTVNNVEITQRLESFWLYFGLSIDSGTGHMSIPDNGFFAVYISQTSKHGEPSVEPQFDGTTVSCTITDSASKHFTVNAAKLVRSRKFRRSNEWGRLYLFELRAADGSQYLSDAKWTSQYSCSRTNGNGGDWLDQTVTFGGCVNRQLHWFDEEHDTNGLVAVTVVAPFIRTSLTAACIAFAQVARPPVVTALTASSKKNTLTVLQGMGQEAGNDVTGFCMVAQGAFKGTNLDGDVKQWATVPMGNDAVLQRLLRLIGQYEGPAASRANPDSEFSPHTLENVHDTKKDGAITRGGNVVEVLYLEGRLIPFVKEGISPSALR